MRNAILALVITGVYILLIVLLPHTMINPGKLVQGHQDLNHSCFKCHDAFNGTPDAKCIACHKLSEIGNDSIRDNPKNLSFHNHLDGLNCISCHTDHQGVDPMPVSSFNHDLLSENIISNCINCHEKPADKIHLKLSPDCKNCHNTTTWKFNGPFNHDLIKGADKNDCVSCHVSPDDNLHASMKDQCSKCHTTEKWVPSTFDHSKYFGLDQDHNAKCNVCHLNKDYKTYTCYGCHEHTENNIRSEHTEEGIYQYSNCISCHKSSDKHGLEHEGRKHGGDSEGDDD
jgi:hypothetical protein